MPGLQPETKRMLGLMLRELEQTVTPDLGSAHAKTVAYLIGRGLRNLLTREEGLPQLLDEWSRIEAQVIEAAGRNLEALPDDAVLRNQALGDAIEHLVEQRLGKACSKVSDDFSRKALQAEHDFYTAHARIIETLSLPQRSAERSEQRAMTPERLTTYFAAKFPNFKSLHATDVKPILSGFSKETTLVDLQADGVPLSVVIRRDVPHGAVDSTVLDEYELVAALHRYGLPVPEPMLLEGDPSVFGEPFMVTRRAAGAAATNTMGGVVAGPELINAAHELAAFLGRLHSIDIKALDLPRKFYDPALSTQDYLHREIDICERYFRNHRQQPSPTIVAALAWLRGNVPQEEGPPRLVHGDAGLTNLMMDGDKMSIMLDWELSHPGDAVEDVTYTRKWIDQFMPWDDFLAHYYQHGGPQYRPEREQFYAMLGDLRVAAFAVRTQDMMQKTDHPELTQMYAAQHYYGYFMGTISKSLLG